MDIHAYRIYFEEIAKDAQKALAAIDNGTGVVLQPGTGNFFADNNLAYLATCISNDAATLCQQLGVEPWSYYN